MSVHLSIVGSSKRQTQDLGWVMSKHPSRVCTAHLSAGTPLVCSILGITSIHHIGDIARQRDKEQRRKFHTAAQTGNHQRETTS